MNQPVRTLTPAGDEIVILSAAEYDRLVALAEDVRDARIADDAMAEYRRTGRSLTAQEVLELAIAPTPLQFWRKRRGLSQAALAEMADCSQPYLNQLEAGKRKGTMTTFRKLAAVLDLSIADLDDGGTTDKPGAMSRSGLRS